MVSPATRSIAHATAVRTAAFTEGFPSAMRSASSNSPTLFLDSPLAPRRPERKNTARNAATVAIAGATGR